MIELCWNLTVIFHKNIYSRLFTLFFIATFSISCSHKEPSKPDYTKTPVFFVHGHNCKATNWEPMISYLTKSGYPRKFLKAIQLSPNVGSNIKAAEKQIAPAIEKFLESINEEIKDNHSGMQLKTKVDLISHSMGALSARWYAAKVQPDRVRVWISLVGANHGTDPLCGASGQGADDMCPAFAKNKEESLIQYELNGEPHVADIDETPFGIGKDSAGVNSVISDKSRRILYVTVRVASDPWIKPGTSAFLDGAGGIKIIIPEKLRARETSPGNVLVTNRLDHDGLLKERSIFLFVKYVLNGTSEGKAQQ